MTSPPPEPATGWPVGSTPAPLSVAASLVAIEGLLLVALALLEAASLTGGRLTMGLTTATFFAITGLGLLLCAWQLSRLRSWARSPVLLAQLIQLGLAWNFRGDGTTWVALGLAVVALIVIAGVFHPDSTRALADT